MTWKNEIKKEVPNLADYLDTLNLTGEEARKILDIVEKIEESHRKRQR